MRPLGHDERKEPSLVLALWSLMDAGRRSGEPVLCGRVADSRGFLGVPGTVDKSDGCSPISVPGARLHSSCRLTSKKEGRPKA